MKARIKAINKWYWQTSTIIGAPIVLLILVWSTTKVTCSVVCLSVGTACESGLQSNTAIAAYLSDLTSGDMQSREK